MKKIVFYLLILLFIVGFNENVYAANNTIKVGYSEVEIHPYKAKVKQFIDNYNNKHHTDYKLHLDTNGNYYLPLQGFGNVHKRKGYTGCTYENSTTGVCSSDSTLENPLVATTTVFYDGSKYAIFITADIISIREGQVNELRKDIYDNNTLLNSDNSIISVSTSHTHTAPAMSFLFDYNEEDYQELWDNVNCYKLYFFDQVKKGISNALSKMYDATLSYSSIDVVDSTNRKLNFVRHYTTNSKYKNGDPVFAGDNHGNYAWSGSKYERTKYTGHVSESDSTMQLLKVDYTDNSKKDLLMVNWQAHPGVVAGSSGKVISADFVGYMRKYLAANKFNYNVIYFTGAAGNLNVRDNMPDTSNEAMIKEVYFANQEYNTYSTLQKVKAAKAIGEKLASYVIKGSTGKFTKIESNNIKYSQTTLRLDYRDKYNANSKFYNNARYIYYMYIASNQDLKNMIEGYYEWPKSVNFDLINYDRNGVKLAEMVKSISGVFISSSLLSVSGPGENTPSGYTCKISNNFSLSNLYNLLFIVGVDLDDTSTKEVERIYSGYHGGKIVGLNVLYANKKPTYDNVELDNIMIGDFSFATAPFEMFDTTGKNIKKNSASKMTFILGYTNGYYGYLPDSSSYDRGCYEVDNSYYKKGNAEKVQDKLISMSKEVRYPKGDVDGDGDVNNKDYKLIRLHLMKISKLSGDNLKRADVNGDGKVNQADYNTIRRKLLKFD